MQTFRSRDQRIAAGKALRASVPRATHAIWNPSANRRDPMEILTESNQDRLAQLIPIRHGRMLPSPFTFLRGSAALMAADLATTPITGLQVQACGDCHLLNFGLFATPERTSSLTLVTSTKLYPHRGSGTSNDWRSVFGSGAGYQVE